MSKTHRISNPFIRNALSFLLSFLLFVSISVWSVTTVFFAYLWNPDSYLSAMERTGYYEQAYAHMEENLFDLTIPFGYEEYVVNGLISLEQLRTDIQGGVRAALAGNSFEPDTAEISAILESRLNKASSSAADQALAEEYEELVIAEYERTVNVSYLKYLGTVQQVMSKYYWLSAALFLLLAAGAAVGLFLIRTWRHIAMRFIAYALLSEAVILLLLPAAVLLGNFYGRLNLSPAYYLAFIKSFADKLTWLFLLCGFFWGLLASGSLWATGYFKRKEFRK